MTFKVGDVVLLNSGGFAMTVTVAHAPGTLHEEGWVECAWHDEGGLIREALPMACLSLAPTDQDIIDEVFGMDDLEGVTRN